MMGTEPEAIQVRQLQDRISELERIAAQKLEEGIRAGEERFRLMADAAPVLMWMSGTDTLCTFFNKLWLEFRGRSLEEEIGTGWLDGVHPDDRQNCMQTYLSAFGARQEFRMEYRLQRHDGEYHWVLDCGVPCHDANGAFTGYIGSCIDLSTHRTVPATVRPRGRGTAARFSAIPLTEREQQVLILVADGFSTKEIASKLGISYKTADSHRTNIMEKLDIHDTATLVRYAIRLGLVQP